MTAIDYLRKELSFLTVDTLPEFAKLLGGFNWDKIIVYLHGEPSRMYIHELRYYMSGDLRVAQVHPILFFGGPTGEVEYEGSLLEMATDRALYTMCEKGKSHVDSLIHLMRGWSSAV